MNTPTRSRRSAQVLGPHEIGVLLGVWAHPDDETYLSAGLMSAVRDAGHRVVVATATRGERGTDDPRMWPPRRLAALRERELAASLAVLDVREHHWLDYCDGALSQVPADRGVRQVAELIDDIDPDTVVTFGPDGMTGHADHRTVSGWVTEAWHETGRTARLWYATVTPDFHRRWANVNSEVGFWFPGTTPPSDPLADLAFQLSCSTETLDRKVAALRAQASQTTGLINQIGPEQYRQWWATESFIAASTRSHGSRAAA
jgi:LmbE family N-acetylglucosaminyl deacetylase